MQNGNSLLLWKPLMFPEGDSLANMFQLFIFSIETVTQLMGGEVVKFTRTAYHLHLSETTPLGDLVTIEAQALHTGEF